MRMPSLASLWRTAFLLALTCSPAYAQITLASGATLSASTSGTNTVLHLTRRGHTALKLKVKADDTIEKGALPKVKLIAEGPGSILILTDAYPSSPGGLSYCQAGEEQFLRVLSATARKLVETFHLKVASCRDNLELADPGITWTAPGKKMTITWLARPDMQGKPETKVLSLDALGRVIPEAKQ